MTVALLVLLKITVTIIIFGIGLDSTLHDAVRLFRQPALLLRSLLAMYVLVPLAAVGLVILLPLPAGAEAGLLVLAVSAGAPLLPRKLLGIGDGAYTFSLVAVSSVLAVILVPLWLEMLGPMFPRLPRLAPEKTALVLGESFFLPLLAGMAVRRYFPKLAAWTGGRVVGLAGLAMTLAAVVLLAVNWHVVLEVRWQGIAALALLILMALIIGHLVGGPKEEDRSALAVACATRHIGIAVAVATSLPGARTAVVISIYIAISVAITLPYTRWRRVVAGRHGAPLK
ncbi:bile acid:sodium symporter family protein [Reyranella sp.]|uniref:bile acid:sodium symporter family protein n=1 Tax=Reyranella sp. TaxID=1929291 RepID=UPI003D0E9113